MYAIIDLGSNTIRLNVYKLDEGQFTLLLNKKNTAGLASYVKNGEMTTEGVEKACEVLEEFKFLLEHFGITKIYAFATAALRNVSNSKNAVDEIIRKTEIDIVVLPGDEEAELDFIGATSAMKIKDGLLIDIGGASTELVVYREMKILKTLSMPIGSLNAYNQYVSHLIPDRQERKALKEAVLIELAKDADMNYGEYKTICGVGGTIRAARKLNNFLFKLPANHMEIKVPNVKKIIKLLENDEEDNLISSETLDVLLKIVPDRVRTILPGMIILNTIIKHFKSEEIVISNAGVREGYLYTHVLKKDVEEEPLLVTLEPQEGEEDKKEEDLHAKS